MRTVLSRLFPLALVSVVACGGHQQAAPKSTAAPAPASAAAAPVAKAPEPAKPAPVVRENWTVSVALPTDVTNFVVHMEQQGQSEWQATMDVPNKAKNLPLTKVRHDAEHLDFALALPGAPAQVFALTRAANAKNAVGTATLGGMRFYAKMAELSEGEAPHAVIARPQTPQPPYPYAERELTINAPEDGKLVGTLTLPAGKGPFPAVLMLTGSGPQDRDETIYGHRPFRLIADQLTRAGVAVLRVDDRNTGKSTGKLGSVETEITDAQAELTQLLAQPEIDPKRIGLVGHSLGGAIAPIIAWKTNKIAFIVSLAGSALPGSELSPLQIETDLRARGAAEDLVKRKTENQRKIAAAVVKGDPKALQACLRETIVADLAASGQTAPPAEELDKLIEAKAKEATHPWTVSYFKTDPRTFWRKVKLPVLVVIGTKDTQVTAKENLAAVTDALKQAKNRDVTAHEVAGVNHLFQHADKGTIDEYALIEETFDPATLQEIVKWVATHTHATAQ